MKNYTFLCVLLFVIHGAYSQAPASAIKSIPVEYNVVELKPIFPGGNAEFSKFIGKNFVSPEVEGLSGVVNISFVIETDGSIGETKVIKDIGNGSGQAALAMIKKSPKWSPGQMNGAPVRVRYTLPITIKNY